MKTSRLNGLTTRIAIVFILALGAMNFKGYAQAYYDGFAFDGSDGCSVTQIHTDKGWETVGGLAVVGYAGFASKARYGYPFMEGNTELIIPEYVEDNYGHCAPVGSIGAYVFKNSGYTFAYIPNQVTFINEGAFSGSKNLKTVVFGKNLKHIGYNPFYRESLKDIYFLSETPPTLADSFDSNTIVHVPSAAVGTYRNARGFYRLNVVGMTSQEQNKIEADMKQKSEYRHQQWVKYVLELKKNLSRIETQLKNTGNRDVYEYIDTFRDPKIVQRENEFDSEITSYRNKFVHIVDDAIDDAQRKIDAKGSYYQQFNSNKLLHFISTFADNISSSDIRKYFDIYVQSESNNVLTIQIHSTKNTKNLYEEFWKGLMPFISSSTYKVNTAYQSTYLSDALDNLSYKILSKIFNEVYFVESVGSNNPYRQYSRHRGNGYNQFSSTTYRFSIGQQNTQRTINILGSRIKASNLLSEIKEKLATVSPTSVSEQQQLKDCSDWCEERFWKCIYKSENRAVYPTSLIISKYTRTTQYGRTNEDKRESGRDNCRFDISQHDGFVNSTEFRKFCVANDIGFDDGVNIIFGCPVIQGGDKAQCLYIIKTDVKLIPNSTSLEIFVGDKKVR